MPYIDAVARERLADAEQQPTTPGELNYKLTLLAIDFVKNHPDGLRYATINHVIGAFELASRKPPTIYADAIEGPLATTFRLEAYNAVKNGAKVADVVGALECAKLEFYRRVAAPYEDKAIAKNGDVYPPEIAPPPVQPVVNNYYSRNDELQ